MVLDFGVSSLPMQVFMAVHLAGFAIGAVLSYKAFERRGSRLFGWAFASYALAEVLYMGYHMKITTFLLSHTLAEVLNLVAVVLFFVGLGQTVLDRRAAPRTSSVP